MLVNARNANILYQNERVLGCMRWCPLAHHTTHLLPLQDLLAILVHL
jgi:hypothetical protein